MKMKNGILVKVVTCSGTNISVGDVGIITSKKDKGYAVWFPKTRCTALFGGQSKTQPAVVFCEPKEIKAYDNPKARVAIKALRLAYAYQMPEQRLAAVITKFEEACL